MFGCGRQAVEVGAEFDDGDVGAEDLLDEVDQAVGRDGAAGLGDAGVGLLGQPASLIHVSAARAPVEGPPGLRVAQRCHVSAQGAVPSRRVDGGGGAATGGSRGHRQRRLVPCDQPIHGHPTQLGDPREVHRGEPARAAERLRHLRLIQADTLPEGAATQPGRLDQIQHTLSNARHPARLARSLRKSQVTCRMADGERRGEHINVTIMVNQQAGREAGHAMPPLPEPGQVVNVRGSTWAVVDVRQQGLPRSPADEGAAGLTHVVSLQSLAEDRLGQELSVVWELEVGHTVAPDQGLPETIHPEAFDDPNTLAAFVDAVRWGAVTSADANSYQAPFRSGANVEAYQLEPLRRALQASRTNLLLADDVGLGKTIEAGLVIQELLLRHRARSVIIVCPPSLALKWQDEMREKFGLEFVIVNSDLMAKVRRSHGLNANPFRLFPRVIVSMSWLPTLRAQRLLRDVFADAADTATARRFSFDVLVVDEAHHVAPANPTTAPGQRGYAVDSQRTPGHQGARGEVRAPAVSQRDPAQRLFGVVHRAVGDDRRSAVHPGRQPRRTRAA